MLVAALVGLSALGQFAHFFLVPHAICAEHGELLELTEDASHAAVHESPSPDGPVHAASEPVEEHEHCQVLARGQREQAEPTPPDVVALPASAASTELSFTRSAAVVTVLAALTLAPKTSPPRALVG